MERLPVPRKSESIRQNNFFEVCSQCKNSLSCCFGTRPPITPERRKTIEAYLKREHIPIADAFAKTEYVFPREKPDGYCVFCDAKAGKCLVHPVKPETCVAGPITFDMNKRSGRVEYYIKMEKICQLAAVVYRDKELLEKHLESAKKEIVRLVDGLTREQLEAILKKDESETFKIDEDPIGRDDNA
jgi:Fe-S-cluster containining protein